MTEQRRCSISLIRRENSKGHEIFPWGDDPQVRSSGSSRVNHGMSLVGISTPFEVVLRYSWAVVGRYWYELPRVGYFGVYLEVVPSPLLGPRRGRLKGDIVAASYDVPIGRQPIFSACRYRYMVTFSSLSSFPPPPPLVLFSAPCFCWSMLPTRVHGGLGA